MRVSSLVISLLLFSGLAMGMGAFIGGTATNYTTESENLKEFSQDFSETNSIDTSLKNIQQSLENFDPTNPLTWGNFVSTIIEVFKIMFALPGTLHALMVNVAENVFFIPGWAVILFQVIILAVIIFGALSSLNKYKV